jgi:small subunit ribosomal protein S6e
MQSLPVYKFAFCLSIAYTACVGFSVMAGKKRSKAPKIQRLVTPVTLQRKRRRIAIKKKRIVKAKNEAAEYQKLLALRLKEQREHRSESLAKKRASRASVASKAEVSA